MNRAQKAMLAIPAAFGILVVISVILAGTFANAGGDTPERLFVVHPSEAPAFGLANGKGTVRLLMDQQTGSKEAAISEMVLAPGAVVPVHQHETSGEYLYLLEGWAIFLIDGRQHEARAGDTVYFPAGIEHSAKVQGKHLPLRVLQVYAPPGPEQRYRQGPRVPLE